MKKEITEKYRQLEKWISEINPQQRIIFSILIPIGLFFLFYPIAIASDDNYHPKAFRFTETWFVWFIYIFIIAYLEYKLFEKKDKR